MDRYSRQIRFAPLGEEGQCRLLASRVLVCGCGALGSVLANTLARAGIGKLRIVDRDFVETSNLQRQVLFDEDDVAANLPKAIAAANKLRRINSEIEIEPIVADVDATNIESLLEGVDCLVDGTDNFETRFLINDAAVKLGIPWVYGGSIGAGGQTMTILPGETPCLRCLITEAPPPGTTETCDTAGILGPIINVIASIQATEAIKILAGRREAVQRSLLVIDLWENRFLAMKAGGLREGSDCPTCVQRKFEWLSGERGTHTAVLCGRNAVQLAQPGRAAVSLDALAQKLSGVGRLTRNPFLLRLEVDGYTLTIFPDGRAIIGGTDDIATARTVFAKYIGA
ncbi:MAG: thiamine biosynthesis protein ThiF [Planctomycetia bacterium 21-64-5]|nr:MAG: thiamine biosynthesis protein ThiF [Planctomycetia bacterium 21-64-5]